MKTLTIRPKPIDNQTDGCTDTIAVIAVNDALQTPLTDIDSCRTGRRGHGHSDRITYWHGKRVASVNHRMLAEQDDFTGSAGNRGTGHFLADIEVLENLTSFPVFDLAAFYQPFHDLFQLRVRRTGSSSDAPRMQPHMTLLNAVCRQRFKCREVLRKADCGHELGQLRGGLHT